MIRRLINRLQGKQWGARCNVCNWEAGRYDLTEQQATNRARLHALGHWRFAALNVESVKIFNTVTVTIP